MFKLSLKNTLLSKPLVWNTRIVQMLIFALIFHTFYFLLGYSSVQNLRYLYEQDTQFEFISVIGLHLTAGLLLFIAVIVWLFHYLRNNPFKSFYPITKNYLRKEALFIMIILGSAITIYHSYQYGILVKSKQLSKGLYDIKDLETISLANCFLPFDKDMFEKQQCCDSVEARINREPAYDPKRCNSNSETYNEYGETITATDYEYATATETTPSDPDIPKEYSYLYYCNSPGAGIGYGTKDDPKSPTYHQIAKRWLLNKQKDSIKAVINDYIQLAKKFKIRFNLDANALTELCFQPGQIPHEVTQSLYNAYLDEETITFEGYWAEFSSLNFAPDRIKNVQEASFFSVSDWEVYGYILMVLSFLLLSFRFTRFKPWIVSVLGSGVVFIIFAIIANILKDEDDIVYVYLGFEVLCILMAMRQITGSRNKLHGGVWLNWSLFSLTAFFPIIMKLIYDQTYQVSKCINNYMVVVKEAPPIHHWIGANWDTINALNVLLLIGYLLYVYVPLAYKWQANPSE